jgi:hypothetical protein
MTVEVGFAEAGVRTPSFAVTEMTSLASAFTGCPIGFAAPHPGQGM